ncbi:sister chromatid cohesion protein PDS5 homolog B isoform X3 [Cicer arietinum]|uniref:Sister chromatid cohesion protein PDS5 homolog A isoform X3 n=1 Tax=Cicer arietinum TaxID=3827 RepID=A0A1S3DX47_CICAR|nr:sister chromatid cohesion protein PDS5 homolog A isoform X3 [Cicer arietinum]
MDESSLQLVSQIGTHLSQRTRPNKDFIVKSLRKAANALSNIEQSPQPQTAKEVQAMKKREDALKPLTDAVVCGGLLRHEDKDVKLLVAICVTELFRVKAPEPPFEDKHLRDVFKLIIGLFADLADTSSPLFSKRVKVLDTMAQLRCCVLMLEVDCIDLVLEMFNVFFSVVRDDHHDSMINAMASMIITILNESEETSQKLLEVILRNLIKRKKDATCAAYQLAVSVIKTCVEEDELNSLVCGFLSSCIYDRDTVGCELKEFYHEIIFQVFQCAPHMLLTVIPSLIEELSADQVDVRIKAVNLVGKLFALPKHHVAQKYHDLFVEFLKRFSDKSVDVRISALQCAKAFYVANPYGRESHDIISSVEGRLLDFDDRVRMQAVVVACDICSSNLMLVPLKLMSEATERLRDKKIPVRKRALQKLMELYRDYCKKCCEGSMTITDRFEEIPCKILMLCYDKDCKEFRSQSMELVLADNLFPDHLCVEERTKHWIHMFSLFSSHHVKALNTILTQKRRLQNEMKNYLAIRKKLKELCAEETQKKIESVFTKMAASFSDSHKAEECLHKLNQIKDNNMFKSLEKLLEEPTFTIGQTIKDELLVMIGDRNPNYEFLRSLFSKCSSNIFSSEHVQCILDYLSNSEGGFKNLEDSSLNLLLAIVRIFPSMLKGLEKQFQMLLEHTNPVNDKMIEVISMAGHTISFNLSDIYPFLEKMCLGGTRRQAKFAVSAIASLSSEHSVFSKLFERLIYSLNSQWNVPTITHNLGYTALYSISAFETQVEEITSYICQKMECLDDDDLTPLHDTSQSSKSCQLKRQICCLNSQWNVPTILQSLGCIAQCSVSGFGTEVEEIISYICQKIIQMECLDDDDLTSLHDTSQCSKSCQLKIYAMKTLVNSFLPYQGNQAKQNISGLLGILARMLRESDHFVDSENDKAHIRLAAATAVLRLAKKWDIHITPEIFCFTILIAKDSSSFVRSKFLSKTHKLLKEHKLPIRFACAFALAVTESIDDLRFQNYKHMAEFIKDYSIVACKRQTSAFRGAIIDYPAYILVYLIHVLAQSNNFPEVFQNENLCADLCSPLFFLLQALVDVSIVDGDRELVNEAVLYIFSIFRAIRKAEDSVDAQMTIKLHKLAEIGRFALNALSPSEISVSQAPRQVLLPSSLYRVSLTKDDASSKCPKFYFDEIFLSRVFDMLKKSGESQTYAQKSVKTLPKPTRKGQQDVQRSNVNICSVLDLASSKPDNCPKRDTTNAKTVKPKITLEKKRKHVPRSDSGSVGLHECSTIEKQQKLQSKQVENTSERNRLSSSDSVSCKGSMVESHMLTRKSKRAATYSLENAVTSSKNTVQHFKCPRTNLKDTCRSKTRDILADVSNKNHITHCDPSEDSSLSSIKQSTDTTRCLAANEGTSLRENNLGAASVDGSEKFTETTSEVVNSSEYAVRTRRKV